jgi:hypothetical protein
VLAEAAVGLLDDLAARLGHQAGTTA